MFPLPCPCWAVLHPQPPPPPASAPTPTPVLKAIQAAFGPQPGDVVTTPDSAVGLAVRQPAYEVKITYNATGRPLQGASAIWAHVGHSGWRDTNDIQLTKGEGEVRRGCRGVGGGRCAAPTPATGRNQLPVTENLRDGGVCEIAVCVFNGSHDDHGDPLSCPVV